MADPKNPVQTLEFLEAMLRAWKLNAEIMEDKKIDFKDLPYVFGAAPVLWKGFVGLDQIDDEMLVIDDDGRALISAKVEEFVVTPTNEELEMVVENLMKLVLHMVEVSVETIAYFKKKE
ncbi:MAG TPA: hypothetical protein PKN48_00840 [Bacteroidales bacterium]|nr:hypothetical protein [Bacteroidales bacterium]